MVERFSMKDMVRLGLVQGKDGVWAKPASGSPPEEKKKHKYGAKAKDVDGVHYDSTREYDFSVLLNLAGISFKMKEEYILQEGFTYTGEKIRTIRMIPDFGIYHEEKLVAIVDPKGMITPDWKIKLKILKSYILREFKREIPIFTPRSKKEMNETIHHLLKIISEARKQS